MFGCVFLWVAVFCLLFVLFAWGSWLRFSLLCFLFWDCCLMCWFESFAFVSFGFSFFLVCMVVISLRLRCLIFMLVLCCGLWFVALRRVALSCVVL